jgi:hypothetical protein
MNEGGEVLKRAIITVADEHTGGWWAPGLDGWETEDVKRGAHMGK